jgi:hypothetical protein
LKPSLRIEIAEDLRKLLRPLPPSERLLIGQAIQQTATTWGAPHLHAGIGIRKLTRTYFECRSGLRLRLVFKAIGSESLHFILLGNHDEIRRFLKIHRQGASYFTVEYQSGLA